MKELFLDSAFNIIYPKQGLTLSQYPNKAIVNRGIQGVIKPPPLYFCVKKEVKSSDKKLIEVKPKNMNNKASKRVCEKIVKSNPIPKKKRSKIKVTSSA